MNDVNQSGHSELRSVGNTGEFLKSPASQCFLAFSEVDGTNTVDGEIARYLVENHSKNKTINFSLLFGCGRSDD